MTLDEALAQGSGLQRREVRVLLAEAAGLSEAALLAYPERELSSTAATTFLDWLGRRRRGEPLAYVLGWREFYGLRLGVTSAVLIPRPETELLVELALERTRPFPNARLLDLGTGSGAIALAVKANSPATQVVAAEASSAALVVARANAARLGLEIEWREGSWFAPVAGERFDVLVSNPPYIADHDRHLGLGDLPSEPRRALAAGATGLEALELIVRDAPAHLRPNGWVLLEHGYDQAEAVRELLQQSRFEQVTSWPDLAGVARAAGGRYNPDKFTQV